MNRRQFLEKIGIASLLVAIAPIVKFVTPEKKETVSFRSMIFELIEHAETEGIKGWEDKSLTIRIGKFENLKPGAFWEIEQGL